MLGAIIAGCAVGGLTWSCKEILNMFLKNKDNENEDELAISNDIWEDIWCSNNVYVQVDEENILTPVLSEIEKINNGFKYIFKMPFGITTKDMNKCKTQIKELSNAIDVDVYHHKNDIAHIDIMTKEEFNTIEGSINNAKWNKLWDELEVVTGNYNDGYKYPSLIDEKEIIGGTSYTFQMPIGKSSVHIIKQEITVKEFLQARMIEIEPLDGNRIEIRAIFEELSELIPLKFLSRSYKDSFEIPIGKFIDGYAVLNFEKVANVLDAGMQGSGKSIATKSALTYAPDELEIYISDLKVVELNRFKRMKHVVKYVDTIQETGAMIKELKEIMQNRYKIFDKYEVSDIYEFNRKYPELKMPYILVVIEEIAEYTMSLPPKDYKVGYGVHESDMLSDLMFKARASGMCIWCTVQRPTKDSLSQNAKSSFGNVLGFKTATIEDSKIICGEEKLKYLRGRGHGYFITEGINKEFQGFYIDNDEIKEILTKKGLLRDKKELEKHTENNIAYKQPTIKKVSNTYNTSKLDSDFDDI